MSKTEKVINKRDDSSSEIESVWIYLSLKNPVDTFICTGEYIRPQKSQFGIRPVPTSTEEHFLNQYL